MAIITHINLKEEYITNLKKTCDEIKQQAEYVFDDMNEREITDIKVEIIIEPDCLVRYKIVKNYTTKGE